MQLTVRDASRLLNTLETTIYDWIRQRRLPAARLQNRVRFNRAELLEWATSHRLEISPDIFSPEDQAGSGPLLSDAVEAGGIFRRVVAMDAPSLLRAVVAALPLPEGVDRGLLSDVLLSRAGMDGMAIAEGIAIPHVRHPVVLPVDRPQASVHFLEQPVDLGARDGAPVFAAFFLASPTVRAHLRLLSQLSFVLGDARFRAVLERQGTQKQLLNALRHIEALQADSRTRPSSCSC